MLSCVRPLWPHGLKSASSSVREIFQARILEWVAIPFSGGSFQPRDQTLVSCTGGRVFTDWPTREARTSYPIPGLEPLGLWSLSVLSDSFWKPICPDCALDYGGRGYGYRSQAQKFHLLLLNPVWLFYDPLICSPPGSTVHEIFQSRILDWVAVAFSGGSSRLRDWTHISCISRWILYHWAIREAPGRSIPLSYSVDEETELPKDQVTSSGHMAKWPQWDSNPVQTPLFFSLQPDASVILSSPCSMSDSSLQMHINFHLHTPRSRRALVENISLLWAENHFPLECHLMAPTLPFYGPRAWDSSHPYLIAFKYSSDSNPRFPHFASCDSSYGWFNTSLILEGRKYLQWLTERWDSQLSFEEGSSQEPGLWWMTARRIYLCASVGAHSPSHVRPFATSWSV